jgi:hypothetical protein
LDLTFFGLTQEYRLFLFKQIHEIVFNGQGGYSWDTVYNMPIWLRRFTFETLREYYEKQKEEQDAQQQILENAKNKSVARPNITPKQPTYTTNRAPKK